MQRDNVLNKIIYLFYLETNDCSFFGSRILQIAERIPQISMEAVQDESVSRVFSLQPQRIKPQQHCECACHFFLVESLCMLHWAAVRA